MNTPIRRIATIVVVMFLSLMVMASWVQVGQAGSLNADGRNTRAMLQEFSRNRGPIIVAGETIVSSVPSNDYFTYLRSYANGPLYASVTGYFPVYGVSTGLESAEHDVLSGTADSMFIQHVGELITGQQATGGSIELTINPAIQQAAMDGLGDNKGAAVAINPKTGAILAMVSTPSFDPNALTVHDGNAVTASFDTLNADPNRPLVNRAIRGDLYAPGSTFKLVTAAAALESGKFTADSELAAPDTLKLPGSNAILRNHLGDTCSPSQRMTIAAGMTTSCNTLFAQLAIDVGDQALREQAEAFGFGTAIQVPIRATPSIFPDKLEASTTALSGIGQFEVKATPLQMAMIAATIANGGKEMQPYLVQTVRGPNLDILSEADPKVFATPISEETASALSAMMISVVESGTGKPARISGVSVAGKTGTAETTKAKPPHAWFVGFAPGGDPDIAVAVLVESGGSEGNDATGGSVAGPIAKAMIQASLS